MADYTKMLRVATSADLDALKHLLQANGLRAEGVLEAGSRYWLACKGSEIVGAVGLEPGTGSALVRSAVVVPAERGQGIGRKLTAQALNWASESGFDAVYCFSTDAGPWWEAQGFEECAVDEVVRALPHAPQIRLFAALGWLPTEVAFRRSLQRRSRDPL